MRCCTIFLLLVAVISIPVFFAFFYLDWNPNKETNDTTTNTRAPPPLRPPQYTQNWSDKDSYIIRASSTVLGRGTLTTAGQFDVSTGGLSPTSSVTTITPNKPTPTTTTTTSAPTTTTTTTTTTPPPLTSTSRSSSGETTVSSTSKTSNTLNGQFPIESTPKPFVVLTTPGSTEEIEAWKQFKEKHRRRFSSLDEEEKRRNIFIENKRFIDTHNEKANNLFTLGINKLADYSNEEINSLFIGPTKSRHIFGNYPPKLEFIFPESDTLPKALDYRNTTAGEPVDQGVCLDSAVYAALGSIESAATLARQSEEYTGSATAISKLSELQVIDCLKSSQLESEICSGKVSLTQVFEFLQKVPISGLVSHKEYLDHQNPVLGESAQVCNISQPEEKVTLSSYGIVQQEHILEALANSGPLAFPIDARQSSFHFYKSGIYHSLDCSMEEYNYHSLLIGFIPEQNHTESHYIIRNSLGTDWGEGGYMRLLRNVNRNKCLPQKMAIYPNLG